MTRPGDLARALDDLKVGDKVTLKAQRGAENAQVHVASSFLVSSMSHTMTSTCLSQTMLKETARCKQGVVFIACNVHHANINHAYCALHDEHTMSCIKPGCYENVFLAAVLVHRLTAYSSDAQISSWTNTGVVCRQLKKSRYLWSSKKGLHNYAHPSDISNKRAHTRCAQCLTQKVAFQAQADCCHFVVCIQLLAVSQQMGSGAVCS